MDLVLHTSIGNARNYPAYQELISLRTKTPFRLRERLFFSSSSYSSCIIGLGYLRVIRTQPLTLLEVISSFFHFNLFIIFECFIFEYFFFERSSF
jgi:hypothetical protein